jgi:hypothetical protein
MTAATIEAPHESKTGGAEELVDTLGELIEFSEEYGCRQFPSIGDMAAFAKEHPEVNFKKMATLVGGPAAFANWGSGLSREVSPLMPSAEWFRAFRELFGTHDGPWDGAAETVGSAIVSGRADVLRELRENWGLTRDNVGETSFLEAKEIMVRSSHLDGELREWGFSPAEIDRLEELKLKEAATKEVALSFDPLHPLKTHAPSVDNSSDTEN